MKIVVTAGGGGHFAPALSLIQAMPKDWDVLLIGRKYAFEADKTISLEYETAKSLGIPFRSLTTARLQRKFTRYTLTSLLKFPKGFYEAFSVLKTYRPNLIVSFGGYVSVPVVMAAALLRIPVVVHEQTFHAGLSNKINAYFAKYVCVSWEESKASFPKRKTVLTGNPLRIAMMDKKDFFGKNPLSASDAALPLLFITGGSLGSHPINVLIEGCLEKLLEKYVIVHQTGDAQEYKDFDWLAEKKAMLPLPLQKRYVVTKFVDPKEIGSVYRKTTLVICRAGINTVSELLYFGKPALLIPLAFSGKDEQRTNALFFKKQGLGEVFEQKNLTSDKLYEHIRSMVEHKDLYEKHATLARSKIIPEAVENILAVCEQSLHEK
ncbi:MAG: UDP-N-acetylglucosamine--N-acetylmuramyl-(pentapeptide) pyrophosphoryl-undecaprenol N-acetylglucosamine transferase [Candidatus Levybacteria bacterium]|nr:UDP-N-acetylglucosamine--N-acetylmuramyl-(pentapeptide) pyrophosphoryl-undecaprenol N-acetylglucosamine transferase [Candidatus Levybacteria bacterium]